jgi:hypothetical protein
MKKNLFPMLAILLAVTFSAFTRPATVKADEDPLWFYKLYVVEGQNLQSNYELLVDQDEQDFCPGETAVRCIIQAPEDGTSGMPELSNAIVISRKP